MSIKVTVTIPDYLVSRFEALSDELGLSKQDTFLHCLTESVTAKKQPSGPTAHIPDPENVEEQDLYMLSQPERLKIYTFNDDGSCLRGEELGELHEIKKGDRFSWVKFSRLSKQYENGEIAEGWERGKNGKLCEPCFEIARAGYNDGHKFF